MNKAKVEKTVMSVIEIDDSCRYGEGHGPQSNEKYHWTICMTNGEAPKDSEDVICGKAGLMKTEDYPAGYGGKVLASGYTHTEEEGEKLVKEAREKWISENN